MVQLTGPCPLEDRPDWQHWVTPKLLRTQPVHRWYGFPHSFTSDLVHSLIEDWGLSSSDHILDPFAGAGTTVLAAKQKQISATGYDISPLSVLATEVKTARYSRRRMKRLWRVLSASFDFPAWRHPRNTYADLIQRALPENSLAVFEAIHDGITSLDCRHVEKEFFLLGLLAIMPQFSLAIATGGWLSWIEETRPADEIACVYALRITMMINDIAEPSSTCESEWSIMLADARCLPAKNASFSAVISSPPYPNRHDYTRVFGVELMFALLDWEQTRGVRYQSFHSHPESHPVRPSYSEFAPPEEMVKLIDEVRAKATDPRIVHMLEGYFLDMYLSLREVARVCKPGARIAYVVGNAQYYGISVPVDELTARLGMAAGLEADKLIAVRFRGNSAQQMAEYGRRPSRESVVVLRKPVNSSG